MLILDEYERRETQGKIFQRAALTFLFGAFAIVYHTDTAKETNKIENNQRYNIEAILNEEDKLLKKGPSETPLPGDKNRVYGSGKKVLNSNYLNRRQ